MHERPTGARTAIAMLRLRLPADVVASALECELKLSPEQAASAVAAARAALARGG